LIPVFLKDLLYNQYCLVAYILLVGMFLGVKLATYTVEYAIYKSKFIGGFSKIDTANNAG
jgi:ABC-type phosphate transport system permease subunit